MPIQNCFVPQQGASMSSRIGFVAAVVLGALLLGSAPMLGAQEKAPAARDAASGKNGRLSLAELRQFVATYRSLVYKLPQPCPADCKVQITFTFVTVDGQGYCFADIPESLIFTHGAKPARITWTLNPAGSLPTGASVAFHMYHGILVVDDANSELVPDPMWINSLTYGATNQNNVQATATYVPVILYTAADGVGPSVCATGDPKIVNN
jgi:hypothetical protein